MARSISVWVHAREATRLTAVDKSVDVFMLPSFPEAQRILKEEWNKLMFAAKSKVFPAHAHPQVRAITEGKCSDFEREDGQVRPLQLEQHSVTTQHNAAEGKGISLAVFHEKATEVGESLGKQMWQMLTAAIGDAVDETGNEVKVVDGKLRQEDILQILEMGEHAFDEQGNPTQQIVCGSEFAKKLQKLEAEWSKDEVFQLKVEEVKQRKRAEFNEREARRRLVD